MVLGSGMRDPGSGKNLFRIPDPGSRGQKAPDPGSRIRNTAWKGFESFLIQRLHACSYREDVKSSNFPWSPTQMGLGPFGQPCKGTPWSLEQATILNENDKTSLSNLYPRTLSGLRPLRNSFCLLAGPFGIPNPYLWAIFIPECHWCKIVSDLSIA